MRKEDSSPSTFFADLANMGSVKDLPPDQVDQILDKFRNVLITMTGGAVTSLVAAMPRDWLLDRLCLRQQQFKELLAEILGAGWLSARTVSAIEADVEHPVRLKMVLRRSGDGISWQIASAELGDLTAAALLAVTRDRNFAFGLCAVRDCRRIFARSVRGRPQKYCCAACKGRGVPSAKKRSEYVTAYRARRREEELRRVRALLKRCKNRDDRYALLRHTFPGRPAKSILYVMRQAEKLLGTPRRRPREGTRKRGQADGPNARSTVRVSKCER
jgi:hypothetical protein